MHEKKLTENQLYNFILKVNNLFPVPLSEKTDLNNYAQKLISKGTLCYKINNQNEVISLVAGYTNDVDAKIAYISMVSTLPEYQGNGLAAELLKEFIDLCKEKQISFIHLYAVAENTRAVHMYEKLGFQSYVMKDETRPNDLHLFLNNRK